MSDFKAKMTKIDCGWGSAPDLLRNLQRSARPSSWNKGDLKGREGCRKRKEKEREGKEGKERKAGEGRGGKGGEGKTRHTNPSLLPAPLIQTAQGNLTILQYS